MNKDKTIKDLKKRNDKLAEQYRLRDIRCIHLEMENQSLQAEVKTFKSDFEAQAKLSLELQQELDKYKNIVDELEKEVKNKLDNYKYTRSAEKLVIVGTLKYVLDIIKKLKGE